MTIKEAIAKAPRTRPQRTTLGSKNRLVVANPDPNYEYRFVNDVRDRVEVFKQNGWEVAPADDIRVGDKRVENPSSVGSASRVPVGLVGEHAGHAVVMRIPKEWYKEDQDAKQVEVNKTEQTMKDQALEGNYGKINISR
jgi:hypothetical protein